MSKNKEILDALAEIDKKLSQIIVLCKSQKLKQISKGGNE